MKTKGVLVILRHGETDYNRLHLMTGQRDIPLNETGLAQARAAGELLKAFKFNKVFSSNLSRAFNTAALVLEHIGKQALHLKKQEGGWDIEQRKEIAEVDTGDFTGRCHKTDPEIVNWKRAFDVPLPGGESDAQAVARVGDFYRQEILPRLERGEYVLVAAHAGIVRAFDFVLGLEDIPQDSAWQSKNKRKIHNAEPCVVLYEDGEIIHSFFLENHKGHEASTPDNASGAANANTPLKPEPVKKPVKAKKPAA